MNCYEKFYRRSYNALNKLIEAYKKGFVVSNTIDLQAKLKAEMLVNPKLALEEQGNMLFLIMIALFGLNKESIENTHKFQEYFKNQTLVDVRNNIQDEKYKKRIELFDKQRVRSTDFDNWLSILVDVPSDIANIDHLRRVRNGLLHSNFYIDSKYPGLNIAHIKTKSYYEAEVLGPEFNLFVMDYFSNLEKVGVTEQMNVFNIVKSEINSREDLIHWLKRISIMSFDYENMKALNRDIPDLLLGNAINFYGEVDLRSFVNNLKKTKNFEDFNAYIRSLSDLEMAHMFVYIEKNYGDKFFLLNNFEQSNIVVNHLQYLLNPKRDVSNWLMHFSYLYTTLYSGAFDSKYFNGDDEATESCYSSLMILKAYLVMYRMQQKDFCEIDYSKVDFNVDDFNIQLISENIKHVTDKVDYFEESFKKEMAKGKLTNDLEVWNKVVCEVIRNSLAHGNVVPIFEINTFNQLIELTDIDKKNDTKRIIRMPLEAFERFLDSEAFHPRNCYNKKDEIMLIRKKSE